MTNYYIQYKCVRRGSRDCVFQYITIMGATPKHTANKVGDSRLRGKMRSSQRAVWRNGGSNSAENVVGN